MPKEVRVITEDQLRAAEKKLKGLRRVQLWRVADAAGIAYPAGATADHMRSLLAYMACAGHSLNIPAGA